ncbi:hypothetical protein MF672_024565 [Actinomadura sp. ATCC 31491]|uniref:PQQ-binding-like beta-propeller repeat protein n=1 Tax=Actinomadura luzonensis TaxID=2805427 RepID=A0ABT0FX93_9ACTN|nr:hypothetical protein [Actinomadura luzonensis]MCK2216940.1 hypothetical protein [Actinomadura luzonensis]
MPQAVAALHTALAQRELRVFRPPVRVSGAARYALSADGRTMAVADQGTATLWRIPSGTAPVATITGVGGPVHALALSADGSLLAAGDARTTRVWEAATGRQAGAVASGAEWLGFGPGGHLLGAVTPAGRARVWRPAGGAALPLDVPEALGVEFAPDGRRLAVPVSAGRYELWDRRHRLAAAPGQAPALSRDALAVSSGGAVHVISAATARLSGDATARAGAGHRPHERPEVAGAPARGRPRPRVQPGRPAARHLRRRPPRPLGPRPRRPPPHLAAPASPGRPRLRPG